MGLKKLLIRQKADHFILHFVVQFKVLLLYGKFGGVFGSLLKETSDYVEVQIVLNDFLFQIWPVLVFLFYIGLFLF